MSRAPSVARTSGLVKTQRDCREPSLKSAARTARICLRPRLDSGTSVRPWYRILDSPSVSPWRTRISFGLIALTRRRPRRGGRIQGYELSSRPCASDSEVGSAYKPAFGHLLCCSIDLTGRSVELVLTEGAHSSITGGRTDP